MGDRRVCSIDFFVFTQSDSETIIATGSMTRSILIATSLIVGAGSDRTTKESLRSELSSPLHILSPAM